ncbi:ChaC-like family protein [Klebsormidium nitens]|uniref:glutathione-specific gamma-glutamylcyclotransferase n=1 Tax=Klebsormidium nitens TaxID=105231 RepID=A0A0U9HK57_KLENI|nr:ChaC-like family protein [Klebsormidium nitens]|eukprot:GAQ85824.1 ChaC-like family protein [Klebsormidium nitens]
MLIENTTKLVAEAVEEFFGTKLAATETCNASLADGVATIVKTATDKVTAFAEEPTESKIREAFANFTKEYPKLAGLSAIADAHVMPVKLAYLRSLVSGACYNDSSKTMLKLFAIEGAVDRFFLPAVFRALLPPPPFGPHGPPHHGPHHHHHPHGPPRDDDDEDDVTDDDDNEGVNWDDSACDDEDGDVSVDDVAPKGADSWIDPRWLESGAPVEKKCPHRKPDPEKLKKCVATNLELSRAVVKKAAFMLCNGPKPPHIQKIVAEVCGFAEENKELVRTTVLLRLQPWKIAIGACLPPPPHHGPHGPPHGPPHDDGPEGPPVKPPHGGPPHDGPEDEEETKVYSFPDVFEGSNVAEEIAPYFADFLGGFGPDLLQLKYRIPSRFGREFFSVPTIPLRRPAPKHLTANFGDVLGTDLVSVILARMTIWLFGYGSLIWRPNFKYDRKVDGYIKDWARVFYQGSTDHRGTPGAPGRTVTLEAQKGAVTWGTAYCIEDQQEADLTLSYLEVREKQYDVRAKVDLFTLESETVPAVSGVLVYIASPNKVSNQNYLGPAPLEEIAKQIAKARGPSGPNYEYLFRLEEALLRLGVVDDHVVGLSKLTREIMGC